MRCTPGGSAYGEETAPEGTEPGTGLSGHSVTMRAPAELLADVASWYNSSPR